MKTTKFELRCAVYLMLLRDNEVLLLRRYKTGWKDGKYSLVSGHKERNESISSAVIREAYEEIGIKISKKHLLPMVALHRKSDIEYADFFFATKNWIGTPTIMERDKCDNLNWFSLDKLPNNILPHIRIAIKNYKENIPFFEYGW